VLYAGSECEDMLGYLPQDLAKVLAPLVDKQYVECEVKFSYFARLMYNSLLSLQL
jgi:hypothetical protein